MLTELTRVLLGGALTFGPVSALLALLNRRDRRAAQLREAVLSQLPPRELRGLVGIQVHAGLFTRRGVVRLDMLACTRDQIWDVVPRLARTLPPHVRLQVNGAVDRRLTTTFTMQARGRQAFYGTGEPSVVAG
jgi:hypothetical protein